MADVENMDDVFIDNVRIPIPVAADDTVITNTVLCVEDDVFQQKILLQQFEEANIFHRGSVVYNVTMASSGDAALEFLRPPRNLLPDLMLIDIMLEGMTGDELLRGLRDVLKPEVAIVMMSSLSEVDMVKKCVDLGADGYLVKPIQPHTIRLVWQYCYRQVMLPTVAVFVHVRPHSTKVLIIFIIEAHTSQPNTCPISLGIGRRGGLNCYRRENQPSLCGSRTAWNRA